MRHSIRTRISFIFIGLMALILFAVWAANTWLLEDYYVRDKIRILEKGYTTIDAILQEYSLSELEPYTEDSNADSPGLFRRWGTATTPPSFWWTT